MWDGGKGMDSCQSLPSTTIEGWNDGEGRSLRFGRDDGGGMTEGDMGMEGYVGGASDTIGAMKTVATISKLQLPPRR